MVRGLALRSLCSLRLPAMVEYISDPLKSSLTDANSYVRKTGVMAILKMWHLWPQAVEDGAMVDTLYNMLRDSDAQVGSHSQGRGGEKGGVAFFYVRSVFLFFWLFVFWHR